MVERDPVKMPRRPCTPLRCRRAERITLLFLVLATPAPALAYIGPGLAFGTFMLLASFLGSIVLAALALVWYPLKRLFSFRRSEDEPAPEPPEEPSERGEG